MDIIVWCVTVFPLSAHYVAYQEVGRRTDRAHPDGIRLRKAGHEESGLAGLDINGSKPAGFANTEGPVEVAAWSSSQ